MEKVICDFCGADHNAGKRKSPIHYSVSIFNRDNDQTNLDMDACNECYVRVRQSMARLQQNGRKG